MVSKAIIENVNSLFRSDEYDEEVFNAASTLMMMKRGSPCSISGPPPPPPPPPVLVFDKEEEKLHFIGAHRYKRTHRWEAYIWLSKPRKQLWFGQHSCAEAAARTSDKAQLVLRERRNRKLNYPEADYRQDYIQYLKSLDTRHLSHELRERAKGNSEGCLMGLTKDAANRLRQAISRAPPD